MLSALTLVGLSRGAHAQGGAATAQVLFEQGRDLLRAGNPKLACPKLAESQRLDPATGTLLALGMCHEAEGKLASAWTEFSGVVSLARRDGNTARERWAQQRVRELKPRLSTVEVRVSDAVAAIPGLEVRRDGVVLGTNAWNLPIPADGAEHQVTVTAPGKAPWQSKAVLGPEQDALVFEVPALKSPLLVEPVLAAPAQASEQPTGRDTPPRDSIAEADTPFSPLQWAGVGAAGAGAASLVVAGYFVLDALSKNEASKRDCDGDRCGVQGAADRLAARESGNWATVFGAVGGGLVVGGLALLVWGDDGSEPQTDRLALIAGPDQLGALWVSSF